MMETENLWAYRGLYIHQRGKLTASAILANIKKIFRDERVDRLRYAVLDFSGVTGVELDECGARVIGGLVHDLRSFHGTQGDHLCVAAFAADRRVKPIARTMARSVGNGVKFASFAEQREALRWAMGDAKDFGLGRVRAKGR